MNYFVDKNGIEIGPYDDAQLRDMVNRGSLSHQNMVRETDSQMWVSLRVVLNLPAPPPSPPIPTGPQYAAGPQYAQQADNPYANPYPPVREPQYDTNDPYYGYYGKLRGVGGWLMFFCIILTIIRPLMVVGGYVHATQDKDMKVAMAMIPSLKTCLNVEYGVGAIVTVIGLMIGIAIWSGNPNGRSLAQTFLVINMLGSIAAEGLAVMVLGKVDPRVLQGAMVGAGQAVFGNFIFCLVWWLYFAKSIRVKNTYDTPQAPPTSSMRY